MPSFFEPLILLAPSDVVPIIRDGRRTPRWAKYPQQIRPAAVGRRALILVRNETGQLMSGVLSTRSGTPANEPILRSAIDRPHLRSYNCRYAYTSILALRERWELPLSPP